MRRSDFLRAWRQEDLGSILAMDEDWLASIFAADVVAAVDPRTERAVARRQGNVAVVPVTGVITPKPNIFERLGFGMSAQTIGENVAAAVSDPDVKAVVLDVDSPGGSVAGVPELAEQIFSLRSDKPIVAHADHLMASAAYWIASAADEIIASPSADVGSIGVFALHLDFSKFLETEGIKPTFIKAGKYKVEGNPFEPLTEEAEAAIQRDVDDFYSMFTKAVAKGRNTTAAAVRDGYGEGRALPAQRALDAGMVDKVRTLSATLAAYGVTEATTEPRGRRATDRRRREVSLLEM